MRIFLLSIFFLSFFLFTCCIQREGKLQGKNINYPKESPVKNITLIKENGGSPAWSPGNNEFIVYHSRGEDGYFDIHIMKSDGSEDKNLTDNHPLLPGRHMGEPIWHPSGKWILFKAEKKEHVLEDIGSLAVPAIGFHNDIWIMSPDGEKVYQLTDLKTKMYIGDFTSISGVLNPHFSDDGKKISWSERIGDEGKWGKWVIRAGDFEIKENLPEIRNIKTFAPGENQEYFESNDFMPDGKLLICGNLEQGQTVFGIDIYILDMESKKTFQLTDSLNVFDECPHVSPDGQKIAYLSTEGYTVKENDPLWWNWSRGEIWFMNSDGSKKEQITHFNTSSYPEYTGTRVIPGKIAWDSSGKRLLIGVGVEKKFKKMLDNLYLIELK
ncbi:MAG: hypothetical protein ABRQ38_14305 [Candidatus Eremiobacterota bacterium]